MKKIIVKKLDGLRCAEGHITADIQNGSFTN